MNQFKLLNQEELAEIEGGVLPYVYAGLLVAGGAALGWYVAHSK